MINVKKIQIPTPGARIRSALAATKGVGASLNDIVSSKPDPVNANVYAFSELFVIKDTHSFQHFVHDEGKQVRTLYSAWPNL